MRCLTNSGKELPPTQHNKTEGFAERKLRIYAVGDFENDYDMLLAADLAACPSNAIESISEISDIRLCSSDEGAIADLIELIASAG